MGIDRGIKLAGYVSLRSVRHALIIDTGTWIVIHHSRTEAGGVAVGIHHDDLQRLDPPGLAIDVEEVLAAR